MRFGNPSGSFTRAGVSSGGMHTFLNSACALLLLLTGLAATRCMTQPLVRSDAIRSSVRVDNFLISLDRFGTGEGIRFDAPFGHAAERLHERMFTTQFRRLVGETGGSAVAWPPFDAVGAGLRSPWEVKFCHLGRPCHRYA